MVIPWMYTDAQVDPGCSLMSIDAQDDPLCSWMSWMSIYAPGWTWLHLDVAGCTLMCLVAAQCLYFKLGGNLGHQCTLMVFDANLP